MMIGIKLGECFTVRAPVIISVLLMLISYIILYYTTVYAVILVSFILFGIGDSIGFLVVIHNAVCYFPEKKGLVTGLVIGGLGMSSAVFIPILELVIVNPENRAANGDKFDQDIADNMKDLLRFMMIALAVLAITSMCCVFPFEKEKEKDGKTQGETPNENSTEEVATKDPPKNQENCKGTMKLLMTVQNFLLAEILFGSIFFCVVLTNTNRFFGLANGLNPQALQIMNFIFSFCNGGFRFLWGFLFDKTTFKVLMGTILGLQLFVSASIYWLAQYLYVYIIENLIIGACLGGCFTLYPPIYNKIYEKNGTMMYGYNGYSLGISIILGPIITNFVIDDNTDYMTVYLISAGIVALTIVCLIFLKEEKFSIEEEDSTPKQIKLGSMSPRP